MLQHFYKLYQNRNHSHVIDTRGRKKKPTIYYLATLDQQVDVKNLPTGYHTGHPPKSDVCDACDIILDDNSKVLICGHGYHQTCYNNLRNRCNHCEQYYKRGVFDNVKSFLDRLQNGSSKLTGEEQEIDDNVEEEQEEGIEEEDNSDFTTISSKLTNALLNVEQW